jgi:hypothetical protein
MLRSLTWLLLLTPALLLQSTPADARIKLATLPDRERVEIQLDNGRYTLVEEERIVPLLRSSAERGNNRIDFSWSNVNVDKGTIRLRPLAIRAGDRFRPLRDKDGQAEVSVVNVAYPPGENALVWEVYARSACALKVRISYLIANLTRSFAYRALADKEETELVLTKYLQVRNYSGEDFGEAGVWAGFGRGFRKRIGQQEDIKMLMARFPKVPIRKSYTFDWYRHGALNPDKPHASRILMHYVLVNDERNNLGRYPLQPGKVRIFIQDGRGGEAFLGEDMSRVTPLDDAMRLYLGEARDVVCTRTIQTNRRHPVEGNLFHQELRIRYEVENFKDKPVTLDIVEQLNRLASEYGKTPNGQAEWVIGEETSSGIQLSYEKGGTRPVLRVNLPARPKGSEQKVEKLAFTFHLTIKNLW